MNVTSFNSHFSFQAYANKVCLKCKYSSKSESDGILYCMSRLRDAPEPVNISSVCLVWSDREEGV
jgi:hypothetical protein